MRERQIEIKQLKTKLSERDETIQTLQGQMEMLRKQIIMMKSNMNGRNHSTAQLEITQETETQTSPSLSKNRRSPSSTSSASRGQRKRGAHCTILWNHSDYSNKLGISVLLCCMCVIPVKFFFCVRVLISVARQLDISISSQLHNIVLYLTLCCTCCSIFMLCTLIKYESYDTTNQHLTFYCTSQTLWKTIYKSYHNEGAMGYAWHLSDCIAEDHLDLSKFNPQLKFITVW